MHDTISAIYQNENLPFTRISIHKELKYSELFVLARSVCTIYLLLHNISKRIYANLSLNIDIVYICVLYDRLNDMAKNTMGTKLPRKLEQKMQIVGEQIKLARLRRNLTIAQVAERATCSPLTVSRIEKGTPTVAIGIYLRVLYALQLDDDILWLAKEDELGRRLQDLSMVDRQLASKKE